MSDQFHAKTVVFEGPLHILLELIEDRKLSINEISLTQITDDYISYVQGLEDVTQSALSEFVLVAATLILIKSKSLLPNLTLTEEEQGDIDVLERRLKIYSFIKTLCKPLTTLFGDVILYKKLPTKDLSPIFVPDPQVTQQVLQMAALQALQQVPKPIVHEKVSVKKAIELKQVIQNVLGRIQKEAQLFFSSISKLAEGTHEEKKTFTIVSFLAVLELVKNGELFVEQTELFGDMMLKHSSNVNDL